MNPNSPAEESLPGVRSGPDPRSTSIPKPVPSVPDHDLIRRIGGGSYGEVWVARNVMGTFRAVKIVYRQSFDHDRPFEREFKGIQKFEPISRSHEGLVDILHVGRGEGYFFYVMELADDSNAECRVRSAESTLSRSSAILSHAMGEGRGEGKSIPNFEFRTPHSYAPRTLREEIKQRGRLPVAECLVIGQTLASALAHVHAHGLVHRDVKPSNIIFVNGVPKLADIGLVADISEARSFVGTTGFIPPEGPGTPQADLYSLGKVLYEISTGKDRHDFPQLPANLRELPDQAELIELNEILLKACDAEPRRRYASAKAMQDDLALLQGGHSVQRRRVMQQRLVAGKRTALAAAGFALLALATWFISARLSSHAPRQDTPQLEKPLTMDLDALNAYAQGRYAYNKNTDDEARNAIRYFERAIALDPNFAEAYAGLASSYHWLDFPTNLPKARVAAEKALKLKPKLPEAHKQMAIVKYMLDWRWADAEEEFKLAIQLDPRDGETLRAYGFYLKCMGRTNEAITAATRAHELDPRSIANTRILGDVFFAARDYQQAIKHYQAVLDLEPNAPVTRGGLAQAYEEIGLFQKAIDLWQEDTVLTGQDPKKVAAWCDALRRAYQTDGPKGYWQKSLEWEKEDPGGPYDIARLYARLDDKESAFKYLEMAFQERDVQLVHQLKTDRSFDKFRGEPEFIALLKKMEWGK